MAGMDLKTIMRIWCKWVSTQGSNNIYMKPEKEMQVEESQETEARHLEERRAPQSAQCCHTELRGMNWS